MAIGCARMRNGGSGFGVFCRGLGPRLACVFAGLRHRDEPPPARARILLFATAAALLYVALTLVPSSARSASGPTCTAACSGSRTTIEYAGTLDAGGAEGYSSAPSGSSACDGVQFNAAPLYPHGCYEAHLTWDAVAKLSNGNWYWQFKSLSGSVHADDPSIPASSPLYVPPCNASLSLQPGYVGSQADAVDVSRGTKTVRVGASLSGVASAEGLNGAAPVHSSDQGGTQCNVNQYSGIVGPAGNCLNEVNSLRPDLTPAEFNATGPSGDFPLYKTTTKPFNFSATLSGPGIMGDTCTVNIRSSLTVSSCLGGAALDATGHTAASLEMLLDDKPIRGATETVVAGQPIRLSVKGCGGAPKWTIAGVTKHLKTTSAVENYTVADTDADSGTDVAYLDLPGSLPDTFYFIRGNSKGYKVTATAEGKQVSKTFIVEAPKVKAEPFRTCGVHFQTVAGVALVIAAGWNDKCPGGPKDGPGVGKPGMEWKFSIDATKKEAGKVALIQLITKTVTHDDNPCSGLSTTREADVTAFYDSHNRPERAMVCVPGNKPYWDRDSPRLKLLGRNGTWSEAFSAEDYLMYEPKGSDVWVALGSFQWSWSARVAFEGVTWNPKKLDGVKEPSFRPGGPPPEFTGGFTDSTDLGC